jgi:small-conductance mechanosensitive channel
MPVSFSVVAAAVLARAADPAPSLVAQDPDLETLREALGDRPLTLWDWGKAGIILAVAVVGSRILKVVLRRILSARWDEAVADLVARLVGYAVVVFGVVYALEQLGVQIGPLLGALGIVGIALAFALRDILENFVAGLMLQIRRPFSYGDQVISEGIEGTVTAIDARSVTIITPDGVTVHLPSSQVITSAIHNLTEEGNRRSVVAIGVAYGTDLEMAKRVLLDAVSSVDDVLSDPSPAVVFTGFGESSIDFNVLFWHEPTVAEAVRATDAVGLALDQATKAANIEIPFPQRVIIRPTDSAD